MSSRTCSRERAPTMSAVPIPHRERGEVLADRETLPLFAARHIDDLVEPPPLAGAPLRPRRALPFWWTGLAAAIAWFALGAITRAWPNEVPGFSDWAYTDSFGTAAVLVGASLLALVALGSRAGRVGRAIRPAGAWLLAMAIVLGAWEVVTAKLAWLPTPFFAPPQSLIEVYI